MNSELGQDLALDIEEVPRIKRASARIETAGRIRIRLPRHWSKASKQSAIQDLVERIRQKQGKQERLLDRANDQARITITTESELGAYVRQLNADTFNVPLAKIKIGRSKYNHLAQVNLKTRTMTVSCYCLKDAPADALRYLIVHELAHYLEAGHNRRFWSLVEQYVPDYRLQSRIIKAFHQKAVLDDEHSAAKKHASRPTEPAPVIPVGNPPVAAMRKTGPAVDKPGFIKQLKFWERP